MKVEAGDKYILCSDGVWGFVEEDSFKKILADNEPEEAVQRVINNIKSNNGLDNITLQVIHFNE